MATKYVSKKEDVTLFPTAFYVIRDESDKTYLISTRGLIFGDLHESRAHFETEKSALDGIKELRRRGLDVSSLVIVPVAMIPKTAIVPKLMKQKSGFVIKITYKDYKPFRTSYYKGNKKKPHVETDSPYDALFFGTVKQTITATIFDTKEQAEQRITELKAAMLQQSNKKLDQYASDWQKEDRKKWKQRLDGELLKVEVISV